MHVFVRNAPLDLTPQIEPEPSDRRGPPLSQGFLLTLITMVAADSCSEETLDVLSHVDADRWYLGQALESVLDEMEHRSPGGAFRMGRSVYFMLPSKLREIGVVDAASFFRTLPSLWHIVTRGDSGEFRAEMTGDKAAQVEMIQPYNCAFEEGAILGFLEGLGYTQVTTQHSRCMRNGHPSCVLAVAWK